MPDLDAGKVRLVGATQLLSYRPAGQRIRISAIEGIFRSPCHWSPPPGAIPLMNRMILQPNPYDKVTRFRNG